MDLNVAHDEMTTNEDMELKKEAQLLVEDVMGKTFSGYVGDENLNLIGTNEIGIGCPNNTVIKLCGTTPNDHDYGSLQGLQTSLDHDDSGNDTELTTTAQRLMENTTDYITTLNAARNGHHVSVLYKEEQDVLQYNETPKTSNSASVDQNTGEHANATTEQDDHLEQFWESIDSPDSGWHIGERKEEFRATTPYELYYDAEPTQEPHTEPPYCREIGGTTNTGNNNEKENGKLDTEVYCVTGLNTDATIASNETAEEEEADDELDEKVYELVEEAISNAISNSFNHGGNTSEQEFTNIVSGEGEQSMSDEAGAAANSVTCDTTYSTTENNNYGQETFEQLCVLRQNHADIVERTYCNFGDTYETTTERCDQMTDEQRYDAEKVSVASVAVNLSTTADKTDSDESVEEQQPFQLHDEQTDLIGSEDDGVPSEASETAVLLDDAITGDPAVMNATIEKEEADDELDEKVHELVEEAISSAISHNFINEEDTNVGAAENSVTSDTTYSTTKNNNYGQETFEQLCVLRQNHADIVERTYCNFGDTYETTTEWCDQMTDDQRYGAEEEVSVASVAVNLSTTADKADSDESVEEQQPFQLHDEQTDVIGSEDDGVPSEAFETAVLLDDAITGDPAVMNATIEKEEADDELDEKVHELVEEAISSAISHNFINEEDTNVGAAESSVTSDTKYSTTENNNYGQETFEQLCVLRQNHADNVERSYCNFGDTYETTTERCDQMTDEQRYGAEEEVSVASVAVNLSTTADKADSDETAEEQQPFQLHDEQTNDIGSEDDGVPSEMSETAELLDDAITGDPAVMNATIEKEEADDELDEKVHELVEEAISRAISHNFINEEDTNVGAAENSVTSDTTYSTTENNNYGQETFEQLCVLRQNHADIVERTYCNFGDTYETTTERCDKMTDEQRYGAEEEVSVASVAANLSTTADKADSDETAEEQQPFQLHDEQTDDIGSEDDGVPSEMSETAELLDDAITGDPAVMNATFEKEEADDELDEKVHELVEEAISRAISHNFINEEDTNVGAGENSVTSDTTYSTTENNNYGQETFEQLCVLRQNHADIVERTYCNFGDTYETTTERCDQMTDEQRYDAEEVSVASVAVNFSTTADKADSDESVEEQQPFQLHDEQTDVIGSEDDGVPSEAFETAVLLDDAITGDPAVMNATIEKEEADDELDEKVHELVEEAISSAISHNFINEEDTNVGAAENSVTSDTTYNTTENNNYGQETFEQLCVLRQNHADIVERTYCNFGDTYETTTEQCDQMTDEQWYGAEEEVSVASVAANLSTTADKADSDETAEEQQPFQLHDEQTDDIGSEDDGVPSEMSETAELLDDAITGDPAVMNATFEKEEADDELDEKVHELVEEAISRAISHNFINEEDTNVGAGENSVTSDTTYSTTENNNYGQETFEQLCVMRQNHADIVERTYCNFGDTYETTTERCDQMTDEQRYDAEEVSVASVAVNFSTTADKADSDESVEEQQPFQLHDEQTDVIGSEDDGVPSEAFETAVLLDDAITGDPAVMNATIEKEEADDELDEKVHELVEEAISSAISHNFINEEDTNVGAAENSVTSDTTYNTTENNNYGQETFEQLCVLRQNHADIVERTYCNFGDTYETTTEWCDQMTDEQRYGAEEEVSVASVAANLSTTADKAVSDETAEEQQPFQLHDEQTDDIGSEDDGVPSEMSETAELLDDAITGDPAVMNATIEKEEADDELDEKVHELVEEAISRAISHNFINEEDTNVGAAANSVTSDTTYSTTENNNYGQETFEQLCVLRQNHADIVERTYCNFGDTYETTTEWCDQMTDEQRYDAEEVSVASVAFNFSTTADKTDSDESVEEQQPFQLHDEQTDVIGSEDDGVPSEASETAVLLDDAITGDPAVMNATIEKEEADDELDEKVYELVEEAISSAISHNFINEEDTNVGAAENSVTSDTTYSTTENNNYGQETFEQLCVLHQNHADIVERTYCNFGDTYETTTEWCDQMTDEQRYGAEEEVSVASVAVNLSTTADKADSDETAEEQQPFQLHDEQTDDIGSEDDGASEMSETAELLVRDDATTGDPAVMNETIEKEEADDGLDESVHELAEEAISSAISQNFINKEDTNIGAAENSVTSDTTYSTTKNIKYGQDSFEQLCILRQNHADIVERTYSSLGDTHVTATERCDQMTHEQRYDAEEAVPVAPVVVNVSTTADKTDSDETVEEQLPFQLHDEQTDDIGSEDDGVPFEMSETAELLDDATTCDPAVMNATIEKEEADDELDEKVHELAEEAISNAISQNFNNEEDTNVGAAENSVTSDTMYSTTENTNSVQDSFEQLCVLRQNHADILERTYCNLGDTYETVTERCDQMTHEQRYDGEEVPAPMVVNLSTTANKADLDETFEEQLPFQLHDGETGDIGSEDDGVPSEMSATPVLLDDAKTVDRAVTNETIEKEDADDELDETVHELAKEAIRSAISHNFINKEDTNVGAAENSDTSDTTYSTTENINYGQDSFEQLCILHQNHANIVERTYCNLGDTYETVTERCDQMTDEQRYDAEEDVPVASVAINLSTTADKADSDESVEEQLPFQLHDEQTDDIGSEDDGVPSEMSKTAVLLDDATTGDPAVKNETIEKEKADDELDEKVHELVEGAISSTISHNFINEDDDKNVGAAENSVTSDTTYSTTHNNNCGQDTFEQLCVLRQNHADIVERTYCNLGDTYETVTERCDQMTHEQQYDEEEVPDPVASVAVNLSTTAEIADSAESVAEKLILLKEQLPFQLHDAIVASVSPTADSAAECDSTTVVLNITSCDITAENEPNCMSLELGQTVVVPENSATNDEQTDDIGFENDGVPSKVPESAPLDDATTGGPAVMNETIQKEDADDGLDKNDHDLVDEAISNAISNSFTHEEDTSEQEFTNIVSGEGEQSMSDEAGAAANSVTCDTTYSTTENNNYGQETFEQLCVLRQNHADIVERTYCNFGDTYETTTERCDQMTDEQRYDAEEVPVASLAVNLATTADKADSVETDEEQQPFQFNNSTVECDSSTEVSEIASKAITMENEPNDMCFELGHIVAVPTNSATDVFSEHMTEFADESNNEEEQDGEVGSEGDGIPSEVSGVAVLLGGATTYISAVVNETTEKKETYDELQKNVHELVEEAFSSANEVGEAANSATNDTTYSTTEVYIYQQDATEQFCILYRNDDNIVERTYCNVADTYETVTEPCDQMTNKQQYDEKTNGFEIVREQRDQFETIADEAACEEDAQVLCHVVAVPQDSTTDTDSGAEFNGNTDEDEITNTKLHGTAEKQRISGGHTSEETNEIGSAGWTDAFLELQEDNDVWQDDDDKNGSDAPIMVDRDTLVIDEAFTSARNMDETETNFKQFAQLQIKTPGGAEVVNIGPEAGTIYRIDELPEIDDEANEVINVIGDETEDTANNNAESEKALPVAEPVEEAPVMARIVKTLQRVFSIDRIRNKPTMGEIQGDAKPDMFTARSAMEHTDNALSPNVPGMEIEGKPGPSKKTLEHGRTIDVGRINIDSGEITTAGTSSDAKRHSVPNTSTNVPTPAPQSLPTTASVIQWIRRLFQTKPQNN